MLGWRDDVANNKYPTFPGGAGCGRLASDLSHAIHDGGVLRSAINIAKSE